jgi:hypothetical protein
MSHLKIQKNNNVLPKTNKKTKMTIIFFQYDKHVVINLKQKKLKRKKRKEKPVFILFV